jgi:protein AbiQ
VYRRGKMNLYTINSEYVSYLQKFDEKVPYNKNTSHTRPYIGILFEICEVNYFAPLGSPKRKHLEMKEALDFSKIDGGKLGVINFNNMLPVHDLTIVSKLNVKIELIDGEDARKYKILLRNQLDWCIRHSSMLARKAANLHKAYFDKTLPERIKIRCCDFRTLEEKAKLVF